MTTNELSLDERKILRGLTKTHQEMFAQDLVKRLRSFVPGLPQELNSDVLLDAMGCSGLSLHIGTEASETFVATFKVSAFYGE